MALKKTAFNSFSLFILILYFKYSIQFENLTQSSSKTTFVDNLPTPNNWKSIKGCPDIYLINDVNNNSTDTPISKISCICGPSEKLEKKHGISINCIYGSTLNDLRRILTIVKAANQPVHKIKINGLVLDENNTETLSSVFNSIYNVNESLPLKMLEIKTCHGATPLQIWDFNLPNFTFLLPEMESLNIEYCELDKMPKELLQNATKLKYLSLPNNKIKFISKEDIGLSSSTLQNINLEGNLITDVEYGAMSQMVLLKELRIGEHNFASPTMLEEISQMPKLEHLDMTRIDGIGDQQQFSSNSIKKLILTGCNFKIVNSTNFGQLHSLEELDLRVNLIEKINGNSFLNLTQLRILKLAGNFLRHINDTSVWNGLKNLKQLDLGWNDFIKIDATTFTNLKNNLEILDLRHNDKLSNIAANTFEHMQNLKILNISHSALERIENKTFTTTNITVLDLSYNNISQIDVFAFENLKKNVEYLNISGNKLKGMNENLLTGMTRLKEIDLSNNMWDCDEPMSKIYKLINDKYKEAAKNSIEFELKNSQKTLCDRPYSKRGTPILELEIENFAYQKQMDTTKTPEITTTSISEDFTTENGTFDWQKIAIMVGEEENTLSPIDEDAGKPSYDINSVKYGQRHYKKLSNTWVSAVIVVILIILTAVSILLVVRRKSSEIIKDPSFSKVCAATTTQL